MKSKLAVAVLFILGMILVMVALIVDQIQKVT